MLRQAHSYLLSKRSSIIWPRSHLAFHPATSVVCSPLPVLQRLDRVWFALRPPDAAMSSRPLVPWVSGDHDLVLLSVAAAAAIVEWFLTSAPQLVDAPKCSLVGAIAGAKPSTHL